MNQRVMLTKTLLKNSLTEMLQTQSIYQISIRELCKIAGINRSTFYKYYGSQFELLSEMEDDLLIDIENFLLSDMIDNHNALVEILRRIEEKIQLVRLLLTANIDPEFPKKLFSLKPINESINEITNKDISAEEYEYTYSFLLFGAFQMVRMWINKEDRESPEWLATLIEKRICG